MEAQPITALMLPLIKVKKLKSSRRFLIFLLLMGCSSEKDQSDEVISLEVKEEMAYLSSLDPKVYVADGSGSKRNLINDVIAQYSISLSNDEKEAILEPIRESLSRQIDMNHLRDVRAKIESMLDLREVHLQEGPDFDSLFNEQVGNTFSIVDWENTLSSIPDMDALTIARKKLNEQFPESLQDAVLQAQTALFQEALIQKLRNKVTKEIAVSTSEVNEFKSRYKTNSKIHVLYMAKYQKPEIAALELKRDRYWNTWLISQ